MRLLTRIDGALAFVDRSTEPYAILSHTWGKEEVLYDDICNGNCRYEEGFRKIDFTLKQAAADGYKHVWVDTCCIDKKNHSELSESINLMWNWYQESAICYVYMADVPEVPFTKSRWFTRGWTLQELLAPKNVRFHDAQGAFLGTKADLHEEISLACGVDTRVDPFSVPVAERYRWSLTRSTTKEEDASYCLLGLLEVSLAFNYGEGKHARKRLLRAIEEEHGRRALREIESRFTTETSEFTPQTFMKALAFNSMQTRRETISEQFPATCEWLLRHADYQRWLDKKLRMIWIKGNPGTGKSTLMKFGESQSDGLSFFFNARGEVLEQSTPGMYRSLLWQLLRRNPGIVERIIIRVNQQIRVGRWSLSVQHLQASLRYAVTLIEEPMRCWIDALDECDTKEVQEMVRYFENLDGLYVCFASRYYPAVAIKCDEILLEKQQHDDVRQYVEGSLHTCDMLLKDQIISKASGNFFWAVLVVRLINDDLINGNMYQIQQRLKSLPTELRALLRSIAMSTHELPKFRLCVHWILFAWRPLDIREFYHAMLASLCEAGLAPASACETPLDAPAEALERFLVSCSRGLAEVSAGWDRQVQFIHESVRDYFLEGGLADLNAKAPELVISRAHENIKLACERYMSMTRPPVKFEQENRSLDRMGLAASMNISYPFMLYAHRCIIYHADQAATGISQRNFLQNFDVQRAEFLESALGLTNLGVKFSLWGRLIDWDATQLIRLAYELQIPIEDAFSAPFLEAITLGKLESMHTLAELEGAQNIIDRYGHEALQLCLKSHQVELVSEVFKLGIDLNGTVKCKEYPQRYSFLSRCLKLPPAEYRESKITALQSCIMEGNARIANLMIKQGADVKATDSGGKTALHYAAKRGCQEVIRALVEAGADIQAEDRLKRTALHQAASYGHHAVMNALLKHGADGEARDYWGMTPLHYASILGDNDIVKSLLKSFLEIGYNVNVRNDRGETALHMAAQYDDDGFYGGDDDDDDDDDDDTGLLATLIKYGTDVALKNKNGETAFQVAKRLKHSRHMKILLDHGTLEEDWQRKIPGSELFDDRLTTQWIQEHDYNILTPYL